VDAGRCRYGDVPRSFASLPVQESPQIMGRAVRLTRNGSPIVPFFLFFLFSSVSMGMVLCKTSPIEGDRRGPIGEIGTERAIAVNPCAGVRL
jgi:hypothetical protein